ncbi:MAG TPA: hypothetical protein VK484_04945, partial [Ferruginibacter sp.]|nr:hypothetical protein [Ferruginibacter sp.]
MRLLYFIGSFLLLFASSCSVQRFLPPGERLYKGSEVIVQKNPDVKQSNKTLRNELKTAIKPRRNKFLLGQPYKVWWHYMIREKPEKKDKGLRAFLRRRLAEPPVLSSRINAPV